MSDEASSVKIDCKAEVEENSDSDDLVCHSDFESCDDEEVKLVECDEVVYEKRDGVAGVQFRNDGEEGWTPVSRRRSRRQKMGPGRTSGDPVDPVYTIPEGASVFFDPVAGTPGLSPCEPGEPGIGCPLRQELGTD